MDSYKEVYFDYLMSIAEIDEDFVRVCDTLNDIPFTYDPRFITDRNRLDDGLELRSLYFSETGSTSGMTPNEASVFEVMIALSIRIDMDIMGEPGVRNPGKWFGVMLENLGIDQNTPDDIVEDKIYKWMDRKFKFNGEGSLFPLSNCKYDQRGITIWDQMSEYMAENC